MAAVGAATAFVYDRYRRDGPRYNVVVMVLDDVHPTSWAKMPHLNSRPAGKWVRFTNGIATFPLCRPSRATILTGQYASRHGLVTNNEASDGLRWMLDHERHNIMWWMHRAGYRVGFFGKYLNAYPFDFAKPGFAYRPPGVDRWHANGSNSYSQYVMSEDGGVTAVNEADRWTGVGYTEAARAERSAPTGYRTDRTAHEANTWMATVEEPFFAFVAHACPHVDADGVTVPAAARHTAVDVGVRRRGPAFNETDTSDKPRWIHDLPPLDAKRATAMDAEQVAQWRSLLAFDESLYDLMAVLLACGVLERTVIIVLSDNGQILGEHRSSSKAQLYTEALRGDIWVRHPDARSRQDNSVVGNIDIAPTICDIGRAKPSIAFDGASLIPLVRHADPAWRERLLIEYVNPSSRDGEGNPGFIGWVSGVEKYAELEAYGVHPPETERYDLRTDVHELNNLGASTSHAHILERLLREAGVRPPV